jgi:hypothetical protein
MKRVIVIAAIAIVVVLGGNYFLNFETPDYVKEYTEVVQQKEEPKENWMLDEDAIQAAKDVIKKKELQAELESLQAVQASTSARMKEVQKALDGY